MKGTIFMALYALAPRSRNARLPSPLLYAAGRGLVISLVTLFLSCVTPSPGPDLPQAAVVSAAREPAAGETAPREPPGEPQPQPSPAEQIPYSRMGDSIAAGKPEEALEAYESAQGETLPDPNGRILHARLLALSGRLGEARAELGQLLAEDPADTEALYALSMVEGLEGRDDARRELLEKIVAEDPLHSEALSALGHLALGQGDSDRARGLFDRALAADPDNAEALSGLGAILLTEKDYAAAEKALSSALAAEPASPFSYVDRAKSRAALGNREGAIADLSAAIDLDPSYPWSFLDRGRLYLEASRLDDALADFTVAIDLDPDQLAARAYRAEILYQRGLYAEAKGDLLRLGELNPQYYFAFAPLGVVYYVEGDWAKAAQSFLEAYRYEEEDLSLALLAAVAARRAGLSSQVRTSLQLVLERAPADSWPLAVARFLLEPSGDLPLLARIDKEKDKQLSARMLFYVAAQYAIEGKQGAALRFFAEMDGMGAADAIETRLARWELSKE